MGFMLINALRSALVLVVFVLGVVLPVASAMAQGEIVREIPRDDYTVPDRVVADHFGGDRLRVYEIAPDIPRQCHPFLTGIKLTGAGYTPGRGFTFKRAWDETVRKLVHCIDILGPEAMVTVYAQTDRIPPTKEATSEFERQMRRPKGRSRPREVMAWLADARADTGRLAMIERGVPPSQIQLGPPNMQLPICPSGQIRGCSDPEHRGIRIVLTVPNDRFRVIEGKDGEDGKGEKGDNANGLHVSPSCGVFGGEMGVIGGCGMELLFPIGSEGDRAAATLQVLAGSQWLGATADPKAGLLSYLVAVGVELRVVAWLRVALRILGFENGVNEDLNRDRRGIGFDTGVTIGASEGWRGFWLRLSYGYVQGSTEFRDASEVQDQNHGFLLSGGFHF